MKRYLVTGGCGFIGSHLVDALLVEGHAVRILDDLSTGKYIHTSPRVEFIFGDVADPRIVADAIGGVDGCFHLAAVASVERGNADWLGTHRTNSTGAIAVLSAARHAGARGPVPVVFASSAAVYGNATAIPISENTKTRPLSAYGADKLSCELHGLVAGHVHRVPTCGLRFFNVYGPRQDPKSPYSGVISIFCDRLRAGRNITMYGDGRQTRDFIFVADVVRALLMAMNRCSTEGAVFNVCSGCPTSIGDLAVRIGQILGGKPDVTVGPARKGEIRHSVGSPLRAQRVLGFTASTDLTTGLMLTLASHAETAATTRTGKLTPEGLLADRIERPVGVNA